MVSRRAPPALRFRRYTCANRRRERSRAFAASTSRLFGAAGWRFMFLGVAIPAIVVGIIAWFYLKDRPADAKWLTAEEKTWLEGALEVERAGTEHSHKHVSLRDALGSGRVWVLSFIYFGFIYGLYALASFLPTIIEGFQAQAGVEFDVIQKGLITAIPYLPAAIALYFW